MTSGATGPWALCRLTLIRDQARSNEHQVPQHPSKYNAGPEVLSHTLVACNAAGGRNSANPASSAAYMHPAPRLACMAHGTQITYSRRLLALTLTVMHDSPEAIGEFRVPLAPVSCGISRWHDATAVRTSAFCENDEVSSLYFCKTFYSFIFFIFLITKLSFETKKKALTARRTFHV